jgi:hypothetical protein
LLIVPGGTHYVPVEFPELTNLTIEKFLRNHGFGAREDGAAAAAAE